MEKMEDLSRSCLSNSNGTNKAIEMVEAEKTRITTHIEETRTRFKKLEDERNNQARTNSILQENQIKELRKSIVAELNDIYDFKVGCLSENI